MTDRLIHDYLRKSEVRIKALYFYKEHKDYADVVREAQEVVELLLKALLRSAGIEAPKTHDVSRAVETYRERFQPVIAENIEEIKKISKTLRKERELAFYGSEDFIPSEEYTEDEADDAILKAEFIYRVVEQCIAQ